MNFLNLIFQKILYINETLEKYATTMLKKFQGNHEQTIKYDAVLERTFKI